MVEFQGGSKSVPRRWQVSLTSPPISLAKAGRMARPDSGMESMILLPVCDQQGGTVTISNNYDRLPHPQFPRVLH